MHMSQDAHRLVRPADGHGLPAREMHTSSSSLWARRSGGIEGAGWKLAYTNAMPE